MGMKKSVRGLDEHTLFETVLQLLRARHAEPEAAPAIEVSLIKLGVSMTRHYRTHPLFQLYKSLCAGTRVELAPAQIAYLELASQIWHATAPGSLRRSQPTAASPMRAPAFALHAMPRLEDVASLGSA